MRLITNILVLVLFSSITYNTIASELSDSASMINNLLKEDNHTITDSLNKPEELYNDFIYTPDKSVFNVPISIDLTTLQKALNDNLNGLIYEDNCIEDDSLKLKVWKNGEFKVSYNNDTLSTSIPIKIWAMKRFGIVGLTYTDREIEAAITVKLQSHLQISKKWGILSKTKLINYVWNKKPTTKVAGFDIPLTYIVDKIIINNKSNLETLIDKNIKSKIPTEDYAKQLWQQIQQPIPVEIDSYKAWINLRPANITMKPLIGENNFIKTGLGIECNVDITLGETPLKNNYEAYLPECKLNSKMVPGWKLNLLANIPYSVMDSLAMQNLRGQAFGEGRHSIYIDKVHTYGNGSFLAIEIAARGYINGKIYLTGIPYFDKERTSIRLKDITYSFKTKNILHKAINLVVKPILKNTLENKFELPMQDNFYLIEQMGQSELLTTQWAENVHSTGRIIGIEGGDIYITKSGIQAAICILGEVNVEYK